ncbi:hypothetical protein SK854_45625 [Lentzea sp. BCCO 10_0061]|uniref:Uncharacterized protein n=1 Tax=Lentzea sokolovensis TaxID=3095429 RepID=A0ABU4VCD8_9PSEU|nr:hypothetical protein [Lentzea sp. BCCO 10_0061]MDX8149471.1 hypothetical protein [Lentzea sp. BCCO 10_0061]
MAISTRDRDPGDGGGLAKHTVGNALVVYPAGNMTKAAQDLALTVAPDTQNDLVVVDLPPSSPLAMWESVAQALPKRRRGVRLVIGGRSRETTALAGHWLAERLKRTVIVPDGPVVIGAGGSLFVHSGQGGGGWVRCVPGKPPRWEAKRFPCPPWDEGVAPENFPTSSRGLAEPLPGGVWIRPIGDDPQLRAHRQRLIENMPCQPEYVTVVLGSPGGVPLGQDDVVLLWRQLPDHVRDRVRFVQFGPMSVPRDALGQAIADAVGSEITFYVGVPVGPSVAPEIFTVRTDGSFGWHAYAKEMRYRPRAGDDDPPGVPDVVSHRAPVPGGQQVSPGVYWYSVDAVVEVVQSGLVVRPPTATAKLEAIRLVATDPATHNLIFDADNENDLARMEYLAGDLAGRLSPSVRGMNRVLSARSLLDEQAEAPRAGAPAGGVEPSELLSFAASLTFAAPRQVAAPPPARQDRVELSADLAVPVEPVAQEVPVSLSGLMGTAPALPAAVPPASAPVRPPMEFAPVEISAPEPAPLGALVAPPAAITATAAAAVAERPAPMPMPVPKPADATPVRAPVQVQAAVAAPAPAAASTVQPGPGPVRAAHLQPVPKPEATGLLPKRGIEDERVWLRRTLAAEFGTMSNSVARILSEHPGFQGALSQSSADVLTDAVAVQLYLTGRGKTVDEALRTGAVGPHVPFARCVVAGLSRLPSHRGPAVFTASPTSGQWDLYRDHKLVTEWSFLHALTERPVDEASTADVLVWSMSARRTKLLEHADGPLERVLFVPGTSFKVLDMTEPRPDGTRGQILLRELTAAEIGADGRVDRNRVSFDELALNSLRRQFEKWADGVPIQLNPAAADRFGALPGLA